MTEYSDGTLVLTPAVTIPESELRALADPDIRAALERARVPSKVKARKRGSFARYAD